MVWSCDKSLDVSYRDHITNEEVKARIGNAIGPYEDLLTSMKRRKLKWYGHVTRSSGLAKTILQGTVQGGRRRGRQRKRWEDNIKEWTSLEWNMLLRKAENREEWRKLAVKPTVVSQRSARLRDRSDKKKSVFLSYRSQRDVHLFCWFRMTFTRTNRLEITVPVGWALNTNN